MEFDDLSEEQKAKARARRTPGELAALAKAEGVELTDEQLEAVNGGNWACKKCSSFTCPNVSY